MGDATFIKENCYRTSQHACNYISIFARKAKVAWFRVGADKGLKHLKYHHQFCIQQEIIKNCILPSPPPKGPNPFPIINLEFRSMKIYFCPIKYMQISDDRI